MGCFNMSCAVTNMPIVCGDEMVVAFACEAEQMTTLILPAFFVAEYNDYGTYENEDENSLAYKWFMEHIDSESTEETPSDAVRNLVDGPNSMVKFKASHYENIRVVFILKKAWDTIIHYQTHACGRWDYFNPSTYKTSEQKVSDFFTTAREQDEMQVQIEAMKLAANADDVQKDTLAAAISQLRLQQMLSDSDFRGVLSFDTMKRVVKFGNDQQLTSEETEAFMIEQTKAASMISGFAMAINCNLITRYASQDTNDEEQSVLVSIMHDRLNAMKDRWEE